MKKTVKPDQDIHIRKKVAGGATGAVLGAVMAGPVGALVGGVLGTVVGRAAETGFAPTAGTRGTAPTRNGSVPKPAKVVRAKTRKFAPTLKKGKPSLKPTPTKSSHARAGANTRKSA